MAPKSDNHQTIKTLLHDTITMLCKNTLRFRAQFRIEGLIGITLDDDDVFLVSVHETVCSPNLSAVGSKHTNDVESSKAASDKGKLVQVTSPAACSNLQPKKIARRKRRPMNQASFSLPGSNRWMDPVSASLLSGTPIWQNIDMAFQSEHNTSIDDRTVGIKSEANSEAVQSSEMANVDEQMDVLAEEVICESVDARQAMHRHLTDDFAQIAQPQGYGVRKSCGLTRTPVTTLPMLEFHRQHLAEQPHDRSMGAVSGNNSGRAHASITVTATEYSPSADFSYFVDGDGSCESDLNADDLHGSFSAVEDVTESTFVSPMATMAKKRRKSCTRSGDVRLAGTQTLCATQPWQHADLQQHQLQSDVTDGSTPHLSTEEMGVMQRVLTLSGRLLHLGWSRSQHRFLRSYNMDQLVRLFAQASVPRDSPYFVGTLCRHGTTLVFYKCPPSVIRVEALSHYGVEYEPYECAYLNPLKIPMSVLGKNPELWLQKLEASSPFERI